LLRAQLRVMKYARVKKMTFEVDDRVWLLTRHFRTTRPSKKPNYKLTGSYTLSMAINRNVYKLDLPKTIRNHNMFHISLLDRYTPPIIGPPPSELHPVIADNLEEWEVDRTLDSKQHYWKLHYLVQWAGYSHVRTS
jgi:hypothetical protein